MVMPPADAQGGYLSPFGGLWIDRTDTGDLARGKLDRGEITPEEYRNLVRFIEHGFVILEGAADDAAIDAFRADLDKVFSGETPRGMTYWGPDGHHQEPAAREHLMMNEAKVLDTHWVSEAAQHLIFAPRVLRFLRVVFGEDPLAFQSLYFHRGSQQDIHQDTAFVPVDAAPLDFVATWIALEDVQKGSGELLYVPGSHRLPDLNFINGKKCTPDDPNIGNYAVMVRENYEAAGLRARRFLPKKGDVLFWAADLCHGGDKIVEPESTRNSLVTHYCPISRRPEYATRGEFEIRPAAPGGYVISQT